SHLNAQNITGRQNFNQPSAYRDASVVGRDPEPPGGPAGLRAARAGGLRRGRGERQLRDHALLGPEPAGLQPPRAGRRQLRLLLHGQRGRRSDRGRHGPREAAPGAILRHGAHRRLHDRLRYLHLPEGCDSRDGLRGGQPYRVGGVRYHLSVW
ncbi:hypothetical protein EGW08_000741, partial [Elysia chlorotica]